MCGIAAVFAYAAGAAPVDRDEVLRMREQMQSRGPDHGGEWFSEDGRVGFGHRRLSIIDVSAAGNEPMFNADGSLAIIFNGEIYNYRALREELLAKGYRFASQSDTEVVLHLYAEKGVEMMNDLRGMYAFIIWDRHKQGILAVRDPFGIKPLYYSDNGHTIRLASQVKALRAGGGIDLAPEPAGHVGYFLWGHVPDPYTMFRNIRSLPAGYSMWIDRNGARHPREFCSISKILANAEDGGQRIEVGGRKSEVGSQRFAGANFTAGGRELLANRSREAGDSVLVKTEDAQSDVELLRAALAETVKYHLVADVPVGVFLSSGLDSTTIAALAAEQGGILRTVTLGFDEYKETPQDETPLAEQFARRCGAEHQTIWVSRGDFEAERDHLFESMDRPTIDGVNSFFVSLAAKQAGLKVALSGLGGDELFASYPSFHDIPLTVGLLKPFNYFLPTFGRGFRAMSAPILKRFTSPKYAGMFEYGGSYSGAYLLRRGLFMPWELPDILDPEMVREGWQELQTLVRLDETIDGIRNPRFKVSALEMTWYMRHQLLCDSDWAGMGHSVEIRVPFVDVQLLRQIGPLLASKHAPSKREIAAAASPLMDASILNRPKTGFQIPVRNWLLTDLPAHPIDSPHRITDRGLRGWAKHVYRRFPGSQLRVAKQRSASRGQKSEVGDRKSEVGSQKSEKNSDSQRFSVSDFSSAKPPKRILVFRIGQLGDTIVSLPAMWIVRKSFPDAHMALLCDRHPGKTHVIASDFLRGSGIFDEYVSYPVAEENKLARNARMAGLLAAIRSKRFDTLVYLAPSGRKPEQIARDRTFFAMAGIRNFIGLDAFETLEPKQSGQPMKMMPRESELLLRRLAVSGLKVKQEDATRMDLGLGPDDEAPFLQWLAGLPSDGGRNWIAVGPGSKMPAKRWPLRRFEEVVSELISEFDVWPVVFGGQEDKVIGDWLLDRWDRGYNAAGALGIRPGLIALKRCVLFLGNDTGTMHMAAAVRVPCVAVFSSRVAPGSWYPIGEGHRVFQSQIECEGCLLVECLELGNECLKRISAQEVLGACREKLQLQSNQSELVASY